MCGIIGAIGPAAVELAARSEAFLASIAHRGPDGRGVTCLDRTGSPIDPASAVPHVTLLHTRLAVLDPSHAADQPMRPLDGRGHLIFNGEFYDYLEHRAGLPRDVRERLPSTGDTAVLVELLRRDGIDVLGRITAMFGLAWVDADRRQLVLARDRFGIKPLLTARTADGSLVFASEIPPLLEVAGVERTADLQQVHDFLAWNRNDGGDRTFFAGIRSVRPGHALVVPLDDPAAERLVAFPAPPPDDAPPPDAGAATANATDGSGFDAAVDRVRETFLASLDLHLRSDVPVGCALSGGIDSSAIAAGIRHLRGSDIAVHAFTHVAGDADICEERWARQVAEASGITLHTVHAAPGDLATDLPELVRRQGEPFGSTSIYAQYRVFRAAREAGVPVMLDGQGADELFAGYHHYAAGRIATALAAGRLGRAHRLLRACAPAGPSRRHLRTRAIWLAARARGFGGALRAAGVHRRPQVPAADLAWLHGRGVAPAAADTLGRPGTDVMHSMLMDARTRSSLPALLRFEDRNSMAHSVESRVPFLEPRLTALAGSLPESFLLGDDGLSKRVLRAALRGIVPDPILERRDKIGFAAPERRWLSEARGAVEQWMTGDVARSIPFLDAPEAWSRTEAMLDGRRPFDQSTWRWISVIAWTETFGVSWG